MNALEGTKWDDISIYELSLDGLPVYIGSSYGLKRRLYQHKRRMKFDTCTVIDKCGDCERFDREYMYIQLYKSWGFKLHNVSDCKDFCAKNFLQNKRPLHLQGVEV